MQGFVDRLDDGVAVVLLDGGGRAYIPVAVLPPGVTAGSFVEVSIDPAPVPSGASAEEVASLIERLRSGDHRHG